MKSPFAFVAVYFLLVSFPTLALSVGNSVPPTKELDKVGLKLMACHLKANKSIYKLIKGRTMNIGVGKNVSGIEDNNITDIQYEFVLQTKDDKEYFATSNNVFEELKKNPDFFVKRPKLDCVAKGKMVGDEFRFYEMNCGGDEIGKNINKIVPLSNHISSLCF